MLVWHDATIWHVNRSPWHGMVMTSDACLICNADGSSTPGGCRAAGASEEQLQTVCGLVGRAASAQAMVAFVLVLAHHPRLLGILVSTRQPCGPI